ncbi:MAG: hypothetical protein ACE5FI_07820 [Anaerolineales bacterium]
MRRLTDQRVRQVHHESRSLICPTCVELTEHSIVEEVQQKTLLGIPFRTGSHQAVFVCSECSEIHSIPWHDYLAGEGPVSPSEADLNPPAAPRYMLIVALILIAILALGFLIPVIIAVIR